MRLTTRGQTTCSPEDERSAGQCRWVRQRLLDAMAARLGAQAPWVQRHIAHCPRCQRRLGLLGQVDLALSLIKTQPHRVDLLEHANSAAVRMLNHDLRQAAEARELEPAKPGLRFGEWCNRNRNSLTNVAACLAILFLTKAGIFSSFDKVYTHGEAALKHYYSSQIGEDMAREIFGA